MINKLGKNLQGKTIAVFGASSNIGRKFIQQAARRGASVIAFVRDTSKVPSYSKRGAGSMEAVMGDITRRKDVYKTLHGRSVEITINFAADFSADFSKARAVNVIGEQNVVNSSIEYGVKRHIFISTIATLMPKQNAYRDTKLQAEKIVKASGKKKLEWIILRYANVLGTRTWDHPFKIIFPYLRLGIPKVPTDANGAAFPYVTIETAIDTTLAAIESPPNQTITVFDGKITIGEYLSTMEKAYNIRVSFLPSRLLYILDKLFSKFLPSIKGYSAGVEFLAHPPLFENETMKEQLRIKTRSFQRWMQTHFLVKND